MISCHLRDAALGVTLAALITAFPLAAQQDSAMKMSHDSMMDHEMMPPGGFSGANGHTVSGRFEIASRDGKQWVTLKDDFSLDKAPDPYVVLSASDKGSGPGTLNLGILKKQKGASAFEIPAGTDLKPFKKVIIWCKKYNVILGQADLAAGDNMMQ